MLPAPTQHYDEYADSIDCVKDGTEPWDRVSLAPHLLAFQRQTEQRLCNRRQT